MDAELIISLVLTLIGVFLAFIADYKAEKNGYSHLTDVLMGVAGCLAVIAFFLSVW